MVAVRTFVLATALAIATLAYADPPPPDLTLTWDAGEMSQDMSIWTTTITVRGTKVHYTSTYAGRDDGMPGTKPVTVDGVVKDPKRLAAALAALDKLQPGKAPEPRQTTAHRDNACLRRSAPKSERCVFHIVGDAETADFKAISEIKAALVDGLHLDP